MFSKPYGAEFKKYHHLILTILRELGLGKGVMEERINTESEEFIAIIAAKNGEPFDPRSLITRSVTNVISSVLFGRRFEQSDSTLDDLIAAASEFLNTVKYPVTVDLFPLCLFLPNMRRHLANAADVHRHWLKMLKSLINNCLERKDINEVSFVSRFCEIEGPAYDKDELLIIVRDLNVGGMETSSSTLLWALVTLANHPDVQTGLHEEIDSVIPRHRLTLYDDRPNLRRLEAFTLELMRYKTLTPVFSRQTLCDTEVEGHFMPAKTWVRNAGGGCMCLLFSNKLN